MRFAVYLASCATLFEANKAADIASVNEGSVEVDADTEVDADVSAYLQLDAAAWAEIEAYIQAGLKVGAECHAYAEALGESIARLEAEAGM